MTSAVGNLLVQTGRPVVVMPPDSATTHFAGRALVAWDGSPDAEIAVRTTLPLLQRVDRVTLFCIYEGRAVVPVDEIVEYLDTNGVAPVIKSDPTHLDRAALTVLVEGDLGRHDYLVMGGCGYTLAAEMVFGGPTRNLLRRADLPVLLVHAR